MTAQIALKDGSVVLVDRADFPELANFKWHSLRTKSGHYARATMKVNGAFKTVLMHRYLMGMSEARHVDHINGNGLDNRRSNLRLATPSQNSVNRIGGTGLSGFIGVKNSGGKWICTISPSSREIYLGTYDDPKVAASVYNEASSIVYGAFATSNEVVHVPDGLARVIEMKRKQIEKLTTEVNLLLGESNG